MSKFKIVLVAPEIPGNTGSIGRTTVALDLELILIKPLAFDIDEKAVRRAGLDYWKYVKLKVDENWEEFMEKETQIRGEIKMRILVYFCIIFLSEKILFSELINSRELIDLIIQQKITNDYLIDDEFEDFFEDLDKENLHAIINKEVITAIAQHGFIFYINFRSKEKKYLTSAEKLKTKASKPKKYHLL